MYKRQYLSDADLSDANLRRANLSGADLSGAYLDDMYVDIPTDLSEVRPIILSTPDRLKMHLWHSDEDWHNGEAKPIHACKTAHCLAGFAHHMAALKRPALLSPKVNVYLVGKRALGDEAASHFLDSDEAALALSLIHI